MFTQVVVQITKRLAKAQAAREQKVQDEQGGGELKRDREELTDP